MDWLIALLVAVATYRLTRIVTADQIMERFRAWASRTNSTFGYLITCDWCLSIWVAPIPSALVILFPGNRLIVGGLVALSASAATGLISLLERKWDR